MTIPAQMDYLAGTTCQLVPGTIPWGPGWYLVGRNERVEAGPFLTALSARYAADWLDDNGLGVHPGPWEPRYSTTGLIVGSRIRDRRRKESTPALASARA